MMVYRRRFKTESEGMFDEARMSRICILILMWAGAAMAALPFMALIRANEAELAFRAKALTRITPGSRIGSDHYFLAGVGAPNIIFSRGSPIRPYS